TWARRWSLARFISCSISALAAAIRRSPSERACSRASSTMRVALLFACSMIWADCSLVSRRVWAAFSWASPRSRWAPSRIQAFGDFFLAFLHGVGNRRPYEFHGKPDKNSEGNRLTKQRQINIHSDLPRAISLSPGDNTDTAEPAFCRSSLPVVKLTSNARCNNEDQVHRDTNTDHGDGVEQTGHQEGLGLQLRSQLRLTGSGFQQFATEDGETDTGTQSAQTDHDRGSDDDEFHNYS